MFSRCRRLLLALLLLGHATLLPAPSGAQEAVPAIAPRGEVRLGDREAVLVQERGGLSVYLQRYVDAAPIAEAEVTLAIDGAAHTLEEMAPGLYRLAGTELSPGRHTLPIAAEADGRIESGEIELSIPTPPAPPLRRDLDLLVPAVIAAGLAAAGGGLLGYLLARRRRG